MAVPERGIKASLICLVSTAGPNSLSFKSRENFHPVAKEITCKLC